MQSRSPTNYQGIDISSNNPDINLSLAKSTGISIVYIKATDGLTYVNPYLQKHYQEAKSVGLKVGFYHFFRPNSDATQQATFFFSTIKDLPYDAIPMLDVESSGGLGARVLSTLAHECLNQIKYLTGHTPVLYTFTAFASANLIAEGLANYPFWPADYNDHGYPGHNPIWDSWVGYQYSEKGNIGGITVDLDEFTSDILIGGENEMKLAIEVAGVNTTLNGAPVANAVMLTVDGVDTAYIPDKVLRDAGFQVNWDATTQTVSITK